MGHFQYCQLHLSKDFQREKKCKHKQWNNGNILLSNYQATWQGPQVPSTYVIYVLLVLLILVMLFHLMYSTYENPSYFFFLFLIICVGKRLLLPLLMMSESYSVLCILVNDRNQRLNNQTLIILELEGPFKIPTSFILMRYLIHSVRSDYFQLYIPMKTSEMIM